jgi:hypothetical protein
MFFSIEYVAKVQEVRTGVTGASYQVDGGGDSSPMADILTIGSLQSLYAVKNQCTVHTAPSYSLNSIGASYTDFIKVKWDVNMQNCRMRLECDATATCIG